MGGGKGSNTTKSTFKLPPEFIKAYNESLGLARQAIQQPYTPYTGQLVAGLTPGQQRGIANIEASQGMALPFIQEGAGLTREAARGITPELYQRFYSPYVRDVAEATQANLLESAAQQRSGLKSGAIGAGAFGGDRAGIAQAEMARQQNLANAQAMANIYNQGYGQAMGLAGQQVANLGAMGGQLAGMGTTAQTSALQGAQAQLAAGAQEQATNQAQLQAAYDQFLQQQSYPFRIAQYFANIAQGLGSTAGGTSTTTAPRPSLGSQILGGLGAIGSIASALPSDKRAKENIEAVGTLNDGQTVYRYNFKGDPKTQIGLLAQEVEQRNPGAVTEVKGLKMVDYKGATDDAASSMGGVVAPSMERSGLAGGGVPFMPYSGGSGFIPEGKIGGGGSAIPKAPEAYQDKGLAEDWQAIKPLTDDQIGGFARLGRSMGLLPGIYASGGVVGRNGYQFGGEPVMGSIDEEEEAIPEPQGLAGVEYPRLIQKESGGNYLARNKQGYVGRAQFGDERLEDARRAGVLPEGMDKESFRLNPQAQQAVEKWHFSDINNFIDNKGLGAFEGKTIGGIPVTREGLVNVAHLGGKGGLEKFITSGGRYNPADANGTRLSDYLAMGAQSGGVGAAPALSSYSDTQIMPVSAEVAPEGVAAAEKDRTPFSLKNLFASDERPSIIESVLGRRLSPEARNAVLNASFALMAGRSPFFFTNLGEAGKVGTQTYYNALQQKRELEKQRADIARQGFEAETGRMQVNVAEMNASRQLYAQMLPQIRFWQMRNPGKPLPPEFQRVIDAAFPQNAVSGTSSMAAGVPVAPADMSGGAAPVAGAPAGAAPAGAMPEPGAAVGEPSPIPAPDAGTTPISGNSELDALYSQLPEQLNPNYWTQMAENAMTVDDYNAASERAAELTKQYQESGIPLPSGVVPFPGTIERQQQEKLAGLQTEGAYKATSEQTERAQTTVAAYQTGKNTLDQAAEKLAKTKTGQLEETKAYLVTSLNSLGLVKDAELLKQATGVQELRKVFSQILFSGGLKDKIGSQIAAKELEMFAAGFGDVNLEPAVNRFIVGTMRGILDMDAKRARDWIEFVRKPENKGKTFSRSDIVDWEINWNDENPVADFVNQSVANTPVMGEIDWSSPESRNRVKEGYKYVLPDGRIATYTGSGFEVEE